MTTDTSELTINVLYQWNLYLFTIIQKKLYVFLRWYYGLLWSTTDNSGFPSRNITKNAETHPPPMCDVIIEQSQMNL